VEPGWTQTGSGLDRKHKMATSDSLMLAFGCTGFDAEGVEHLDVATVSCK